ncbi:SDR family oxidoreductase [Nostocoides sp. F2B08]|uniref:SDR family oxidoreductase n=1 Tax=Nostocoides sp. F2B08 TaxID=2653936 RepID=UPI00186B17EE|nr:NmrA family NAD(P)-binding protein [Tetrasphaera sp. F2B08]
MILVCGATGDLGGRIVQHLVDADHAVRALVRPETSADALEDLGVEIARGDLRDEASLAAALVGVDTVVTTANAISRVLAGAKDVSIASVDLTGNRNLVAAAREAGVHRFVFVSAAGVDRGMADRAPLVAAKRATERLLRDSGMEVVLARPDMFQEVWLAPASGIDPAKGTALVYGKGNTPQRYVAVEDVARLVAKLAVADDPPRIVEVGGPEQLTRNEVVAAFEAATGRRMTVRHVPRVVLAVASRLLGRPKPALASLMGMALHTDLHPGEWDDAPLRDAGIDPTPASAYIAGSVRV